MTTTITHNQHTTFTIATPGDHVFVVNNVSADLVFTIAHAGARVRIVALYDTAGSDVHTLTTLQHHTVPGATSSAVVGAVLRGTSRLTYRGTIRIDAAGSGTTATLDSRTMLLGANALVRTTPILEILPADVVCSHAATVAAPDDAQIAYLCSRGLTRRAARDAIAAGFLAAVRATLPVA